MNKAWLISWSVELWNNAPRICRFVFFCFFKERRRVQSTFFVFVGNAGKANSVWEHFTASRHLGMDVRTRGNLCLEYWNAILSVKTIVHVMVLFWTPQKVAVTGLHCSFCASWYGSQVVESMSKASRSFDVSIGSVMGACTCIQPCGAAARFLSVTDWCRWPAAWPSFRTWSRIGVPMPSDWTYAAVPSGETVTRKHVRLSSAVGTACTNWRLRLKKFGR